MSLQRRSGRECPVRLGNCRASPSQLFSLLRRSHLSLSHSLLLGTHIAHAEDAVRALHSQPFLPRDVVPATQPAALQPVQSQSADTAPTAADQPAAKAAKRKRGGKHKGIVFPNLCHDNIRLPIAFDKDYYCTHAGHQLSATAATKCMQYDLLISYFVQCNSRLVMIL